MANQKTGCLLIIGFDRNLWKQVWDELNPLCKVESIHSMDELEKATIEPEAVTYVMDYSSAIHLYNIKFIRQKYPNKQLVIITTSISIPLLHESLHIGVNDLFISPLTKQDKQSLFDILKHKTCVNCVDNEIEKNNIVCCAHIKTHHPMGVVLDILEKNYDKNPSLQDLSDEIYLSPSRICHLFKDVCGITYSSYLLCRKVEEAERLLSLAEHSVTAISYQLGFANPSHFCRSFKDFLNITPTAYASGNRVLQQSLTYLLYQRVRIELFADTISEKQEMSVDLLEKYHVS